MLGRSRLTFIGSIALALILGGLAARSGELLALALPFVIFISAGLFAELEEVKLQAARTLSAERVYGGEEVSVKLKVENMGNKLAELQLFDQVPEALKISNGEASAIVSLAAHETLELEYTVSGHRGYFEWSGLKAILEGLQCKEFLIDCPGALYIMPRFEELHDIEIRPRRTRVYSGIVRANQGGPGVEFFGVRQYYPGDAFKWINWKATARRDELVTNEYEQERVADVAIILDARIKSNVWANGESLFEHSVRAAASFARFFINKGNNVGLLIYGSFLDWTFPGYGRWQRERIMRSLARAELGDKIVFEGLENLPARLFPIRSQIVLVSPLLEQDIEVLRRLRARDYHVIVVSPNPVEFEVSKLPQSDAIKLAARIARLERQVLLDKLRRAGIRVLDWNVHEPLADVAERALGRVTLLASRVYHR